MSDYRIRPYEDGDRSALEALEARVDPYRPEHMLLVEEMYIRARQAEAAGDPRWMAPPPPLERAILADYEAFWVVEPVEGTVPELVGMIGAQTLRAGEILPGTHPLTADWAARGPVAELRRLRVAPEARRQALGWQLCTLVLDWVRENGYRTLVVNTTTPQLPALALYRKFGFRNAGISFVGKYELTWLEMNL